MKKGGDGKGAEDPSAELRTGLGVVLVTCSDWAQGERLAQGLVENRLAACVNVVRGVDSFFWWEGKLDRAQEVLLIIKTLQSKFLELEKHVKAHHSYEVPEMIFLPIVTGHEPYLEWMKKSLRA